MKGATWTRHLAYQIATLVRMGRVGGSIVDLGPTSVGVREAMVGSEVVASLPAVFQGPMGVSRYYGWTGTWIRHVSCTWKGGVLVAKALGCRQ